jgi:hypothetical protein
MFLEQDDRLLVHEVNHSVRQLCKTIDAFIFVVDSSTSKEKGNCTIKVPIKYANHILINE